jgi:hypothetical protein
MKAEAVMKRVEQYAVVIVALFAVAIAGIFVLTIIGVEFEAIESGLGQEIDNPVTKILEALGDLLEFIAYVTLGAGAIWVVYQFNKPNKY